MGPMLLSWCRDTYVSVPQIRLRKVAWNASTPSAPLTQHSLTNAPRPSIPHNCQTKDSSVLAQSAIAELFLADEDVEVNNAAESGAERPNHLCKGQY